MLKFEDADREPVNKADYIGPLQKNYLLKRGVPHSTLDNVCFGELVSLG